MNKIIFSFFFLITFSLGKSLFEKNCFACHQNGNNIIIPEKSLKKSILKSNGMDNVDSILYQITNGKNGMPAFGGRIKENEMKEIANYVFSFPFDQKEN